MDKIREYIHSRGNQGSSVVELSLIMPVIFGILVLVIWLFLDTVTDGLVQQDGYCTIYTFREDAGDTGVLDMADVPVGEESAEGAAQGYGWIDNDRYIYTREGHVFETEIGVCSKRLRRWQVYGNIICE